MIDMVKEAILELKERGGSSLVAIKKYTGVNHNLDFSCGSDKVNLLKALKHGVTKGVLLQNKASYKVANNAAKPKKDMSGREWDRVARAEPASANGWQTAHKKAAKKKSSGNQAAAAEGGCKCGQGTPGHKNATAKNGCAMYGTKDQKKLQHKKKKKSSTPPHTARRSHKKKSSAQEEEAAAAAADSANDVRCQHCGITEAEDELATFVKCAVRSCKYHKCFQWEGECSGLPGENANNYCSVCEETDAYFCPSHAAPGRKCYKC